MNEYTKIEPIDSNAQLLPTEPTRKSDEQYLRELRVAFISIMAAYNKDLIDDEMLLEVSKVAISKITKELDKRLDDELTTAEIVTVLTNLTHIEMIMSPGWVPPAKEADEQQADQKPAHHPV